MKILLDPIYSAQPRRCSTAAKCMALVQKLLFQDKRTDVFFYWMIPEWSEEEDLAWLPQHPNVRLVQYPYHKDRMREYHAFTRELDDMLAFNGSWWDFDILLTSRTAMVPTSKIVMTSPRNYNMTWMKAVILLEEMPVMTFKKTVAVSDRPIQDLATLSGYLAADHTFVTVGHERDNIIRLARTWFPPSKVMEISENVRVVSPANIDTFLLKKKKDRFVPHGDRKFCLGFVTRVSNVAGRIKQVYNVMEKQWIMGGTTGVRLVMSTVSTGIKIPPPAAVELMHLPRDEFHALVKTELDAVICLPIDAGFGMSMMEPLMFGTPIIMIRAGWSEALLGTEYPLFVKNETEAYAMAKMLFNDYGVMYDRFAKWQQGTLTARFSKDGPYATNMFDEIIRIMDQHDVELREKFKSLYADKANNEIAQTVLARVGKEFTLFDTLNELSSEGVFRTLQAKLKPGDRERRGIVWSTPWNELRAIFRVFYGYEDASTTVGHLKKTGSAGKK